jgi:ADP-ribose pyrophosphatase YjhB (NUDIX family)
MRRRYPEAPLVGLGAILFRQDEVLLVKRGKDPGSGIWTLPGGLLEVGETVREGTAREVMEECGLDVEVLDLVETVERILIDQAGQVEYHYVILDFLARWKAGEVVPASDVIDARWVQESALGNYRVSLETQRVISKAREMWNGRHEGSPS